MQGEVSAQQRDNNGYVTIERNPISRTGVFQYLGRSLPDADPDRIYNVFRPEEELSHPDAIESFRLIPLINEHVMLGDGYETTAEQKGIHGTTGEDVSFQDGVLYAPLKIFSTALRELIASGKKGLSLGYRCMYEKTSGVFNGQAYDYIQRNIRGNHIALVQEGRMGKDIAVLDHWVAFDSFDLNREFDMADEVKTEEKEMTLAECVAVLKEIMPQIKALNDIVMAKKDDVVVDEEINPTSAGLDEEKKDKEAKDAEKEKEKDAMDAKIQGLTDEVSSLKREGIRAVVKEVSKRDKLAKDISQFVGTFDSSEMTAADVAKYGIQKLGLSAAAGQEEAVLTGYIAGHQKAAATTGATSFAMDATAPKSGTLLANRLNKTA